MANNWNYAELSKAAKAAGGPETYVELLELSSKDEGRMEMVPWVLFSAACSSLLTFATIKVVDYYNSRKKTNQKEINFAKQEIIKGIKEYDIEQENKEGENENE